MKTSIKKSTYSAIYHLFNKVSPIDDDCGLFCGAACCTCGGDATCEDGLDYELGIYLLPGEDKLFTKKETWLKWNIEYAEDFDFPDSWFGKIYFVRCKTPPVCPREMRPLQCRFFPLAPHLTENDELQLILSTSELPYTCPLITANKQLNRNTNFQQLNKRFIKANYTVWKHLIRDPLIFDLVKLDSNERIETEMELSIVK